MSEAVLVAIVYASGTLAVAIVTAVFGPAVLSKLRRIEGQVANDHKHPDGTPINLRDDLDGKHDENTAKLDRLVNLMAPLERDVRWLMRRVADLAEAQEDLEDTLRTKGQTT